MVQSEPSIQLLFFQKQGCLTLSGAHKPSRLQLDAGLKVHDLAIRAPNMAIALRGPPKGCIHHSERSGQIRVFTLLRVFFQRTFTPRPISSATTISVKGIKRIDIGCAWQWWIPFLLCVSRFALERPTCVRAYPKAAP